MKKTAPVIAACLAAAVPTAPVAAQQSTPIRLNQVGLLPDGKKMAIVPASSTAPFNWRLVRNDGSVAARGKTRRFGPDRWSGETVHQIDFSTYRVPGTGYRLEAGGKVSRRFDIRANAFGRLPYDAFAYFYHARAGIPIEASLVGKELARPAGHLNERASCISGKDESGNIWPGCPFTRDVSGGWYDAGDHGKYVVNGGISVWTLLNLYERNRLFGGSLFADGEGRVPEGRNGVPDILDEARWELEFFLKMQVPDGTRLSLPAGAKKNVPGLKFVDVDASGMVHHKVGDARWTAIPTRPDRDMEPRMLFPPSTAATLNFAATTAQCARIWRDIDPAFAARCLTASEKAWAGAARNPEIYAIDQFPGSGGYGDSDVSDEFYWAAAELLVTTEKPAYRAAVQQAQHFTTPIRSQPGWPGTAPLGTISLALHPGALGVPGTSALRKRIVAAADRFLGDVARTGYAMPLAPAGGYAWGSNSEVLNRAMMLGLAADFTGRRKYRDGVIDALDYILGRNPLDRSYVTGYGARPMEHPHHRFWAKWADPSLPAPPPGVVSGGPNSINSPRADEPVGPKKGCAPQTCWVDDARSFTANEVAINWNAPLVWVSAWLAQSSAAPAGKPQVALTIDDLPEHGPYPPGESPRSVGRGIIAALSAANIENAYGFINGIRLQERPATAEVLDDWNAAGFPVGNHGWSHRHFNEMTAAEFERELTRNELVLARTKQPDTRWFRYPFLDEGKDGAQRAAGRFVLARNGYRVAAVTMDFSDWQWTAPYARCAAAKDFAAVAKLESMYMQSANEGITFSRSLSRRLYGRDIPYVLLLHASAFEARMLPRLLELFRGQGFAFVGLPEAQADPAYADQADPKLPAEPQGLEGKANARGIALPHRTNFAPALDAMCPARTG